ncbi:hypothetical protein QE250_16615 [Chromatiaceae bacterium AAb-1]|nr:hypothetical protein [Chromatiaceae bacterium AAb-1]
MVKLVECKGCRGMVAEYAKKCPSFGTESPAERPIDLSKLIKPVLGISFALLVALSLYSWISDSPEERQQKAEAKAQKRAATEKQVFTA